MRSQGKIRTLYIGGLPPQTSAEAVHAACGRFGPIEDLRLIHRRDGTIAYVTFVAESAAHEARKALDGSTLEGQRLRVALAS